MELGKIVPVPLKELWIGEATHFTPWLASNLNVLGEKIGMDLELETVEASAGDFSADIVARDLASGKRVVIENQYGWTDHRHLGQIITYASVLGAGVVVWIAENVRPEHKSAMDFLNQNLKQSLALFAVEASAIRIDDSKPAFVLTAVSMPSEVAVDPDGGATISETAERYRVFFQGLIDDLREKHRFTNAKTGQPQNWYNFTSENSKVYTYSASFAKQERARVEVYIDCRDKARNEALFEELRDGREEIEEALGFPLEWEKLENRRACRVAAYREGDIDADSETLAEIKDWMIGGLLKLKAVFPARIAEILASSDKA